MSHADKAKIKYIFGRYRTLRISVLRLKMDNFHMEIHWDILKKKQMKFVCLDTCENYIIDGKIIFNDSLINFQLFHFVYQPTLFITAMRILLSLIFILCRPNWAVKFDYSLLVYPEWKPKINCSVGIKRTDFLFHLLWFDYRWWQNLYWDLMETFFSGFRLKRKSCAVMRNMNNRYEIVCLKHF